MYICSFLAAIKNVAVVTVLCALDSLLRIVFTLQPVCKNNYVFFKPLYLVKIGYPHKVTCTFKSQRALVLLCVDHFFQLVCRIVKAAYLAFCFCITQQIKRKEQAL